jgi:hypothetical protein
MAPAQLCWGAEAASYSALGARPMGESMRGGGGGRPPSRWDGYLSPSPTGTAMHSLKQEGTGIATITYCEPRVRPEGKGTAVVHESCSAHMAADWAAATMPHMHTRAYRYVSGAGLHSAHAGPLPRAAASDRSPAPAEHRRLSARSLTIAVGRRLGLRSSARPWSCTATLSGTGRSRSRSPGWLHTKQRAHTERRLGQAGSHLPQRTKKGALAWPSACGLPAQKAHYTHMYACLIMEACTPVAYTQAHAYRPLNSMLRTQPVLLAGRTPQTAHVHAGKHA